MAQDELDPKGLIREAYKIEGITAGECRSIFLDWALSVEGADQKPRIEALIARHGESDADHPMTAVLQEGLQASRAPKRRGGWRSRER